MGLYDMTIGTLLVGIFINTFLYGFVTYQFAVYHRTKFDDRPAVKYMVLFLFVLDTFYSVLAIYMAWLYIVTNYDNPVGLSEVVLWPFAFTPVCTALTALVTHIYLGYRIWRFTNSNILHGAVIVLMTCSFILGASTSGEGFTLTTLSESPRITPVATAWLSMEVVVDSFITTTLVIIFSRSRTGFRKTDTILNRLIRGSVQTGLFTVVFSTCDLITFLLYPNSNLYGVFSIPIGRIYTNTLLDTLLVRESLKAEMDGTDQVNGALGSLGWTTDSSQTTSSAKTTSSQSKVQKTMRLGDVRSLVCWVRKAKSSPHWRSEMTPSENRV